MATVQTTKSTAPITLGRLLTTAVAMFLGAAGVVHLSAAGKHLEHPVIAAAFIAMGAVQVVVAGAVVANASRARLAAAAIVSGTIVCLWVVTRVMAIGWIDGLESVQPIGAEDLVATALELAVVGGAALLLIVPAQALGSILTAGQRPLATTAATALVLMSVGVIAPHNHDDHDHGRETLASAAAAELHADGHSHAAPARRAGSASVEAAGAHEHAPITYEEAEAVLTGPSHNAGGGHAHGELSLADVDDVSEAAPHSHGSSPAASHSHPSGASHATPREEQVILQGSKGSQFEGRSFTYEPATPDGKHGAAFRSHNPDQDKAHAEMHAVNKPCSPTTKQRKFADRLLRDSKTAIAIYDNNPGRALADGFIAYPIPLSKMFHMVNVGRTRADSYELTPTKVESFMYAMTDSGLKAVGAMYIFSPKDKTPPNPTGCIMQWHRHTGMQGAVTSFDPNEPFASVWMAHVWTFGYDDPWRDGDGTEPHTWFMGYRYLPNVCDSTGQCV
jgi:hypothetical protein